MRSHFAGIGFAVVLAMAGMGCGDDGDGDGSGLTDEQQMCVEEAGDSSDCTVCGCINCLQELNDCNAIEGCREIVDCALETGCTGTNCYIGNDQCMMVIDDNGGPFGTAAGQAQIVSDCVVGNGCPCEMGEPPPDAGFDAGTDGGSSSDAGTDSGT